jgi:glycosyltransferase involved in cell wall biosynthesis
MKLLIVTQTVDPNDPILGFFQRWIHAFGRRCESVTVIGQTVGAYSPMGNVRVESLGKEEKRSSWQQVLHFWRLLITLRNSYDVVLVHMTPIWIVLGAPILLVLRKPMYLWYEARGTRWPLRLALLLVRKVFSASQYGMPLHTHKSVIVGHGIDTDFFLSGDKLYERGHLLTVGRITRAKQLDVLFEALATLPQQFHLTLAGQTRTNADKVYLAELKEFLQQRGLSDRVEIESVSHAALLPLLHSADVFIHASDTSLDKAVLEAMAAGCPVVSCAAAVQTALVPVCQATTDTLTERIRNVSELHPEQRQDLLYKQRTYVEEQHSLPHLIDRLVEEMTS